MGIYNLLFVGLLISVCYADYISLSCAAGPYDVQYGDVNVTCSLSVEMAEGIQDAWIEGYLGNRYVYAYEPEYTDATSSVTRLVFTYILRLPQYAPYGEYTVLGWSFGPNLATSQETYSSFSVLQTKNDMNPPQLTSFSVPVANTPDVESTGGTFTATADVAGLRSIQVYILDANGNVLIEGFWAANNNEQELRSVTSSFLWGAPWYSPPAPGVYNLEVQLQDWYDEYDGLITNLDAAQLNALGFPSTVTFVGSNNNNCAAGMQSCGAACYNPNEYVCYYGNNLCPAGLEYCQNGACYNSQQYSCVNGQLQQVG